MATLLLELFSEEIPARMQAKAAADLAANVQAKLVDATLLDAAQAGSKITTYVTPRRLALMVEGLPQKQPDRTVEKKGPKVSAPAQAIDGFLRGARLTLDQLEKRTIGKDEVYFSIVEEKGRATEEILKELLEAAIGELVWPKSMRWGDYDIRWVRPLHSICCLLDNQVVPVQFGHITASNIIYGHRFLSPEAITIEDAKQYSKKLEKAHVLVDAETRKETIRKQINALAKKHDLTVRLDEALLDEVTGLVEWPVALMGKIEDRFMALPHELLQVTMRYHQKYFTTEDADGNIAPQFIFIANRHTEDDGQQIIAGNQRVLRARFSDAEFFFTQDQKKSLKQWATGLDKVTFHAKLGTVADRVERIKTLAVKLSELCYPTQSREVLIGAAAICKADLVTGMVGEFPELQGIIGSYYAKAEGKPDDVADALYHLYDHPSDLKNLSATAQIICMADRLDMLISLFSINEKPTGSKDPFALRRAALGLIAIIRNHNLRLNLHQVLSAILKDNANTADELLDFLNDRLEAALHEQGIERTTIRAIGGLQKDHDLIRVNARAKALQAFLTTPQSEAMLAAYKRAKNILSAEEKKDKKTYKAADLDPSMLSEPAEQALYQVLHALHGDIKPLMQQEKYAETMQHFAMLKGPLDQFFDDIMVNADDPNIRTNRLRLLASIIEVMHLVADFSEVAS